MAKSDKLSIEDVLGAEEYARQQEEETEEARLRCKVAELEEQEKQVADPRFVSLASYHDTIHWLLVAP